MGSEGCAVAHDGVASGVALRRATCARVEVDDKRQLETALLSRVETLFEVWHAPVEANERCD